MNKKMLVCKFKRHENLDKYKKVFLSKIKSHVYWLELGMYPDELFIIQVVAHGKKHEQSPEHNRNGMFQFWLNKNMTNEEIIKLKKLASLDEDESLREYVLNQIEDYEVKSKKG